MSVKSVEEVNELQRIETEERQVALDNMHREVHGKVTAKREREKQRHNSKTGVRPINSTTGDYVLRGIVKKKQSKKTEPRWRGPYRVTACLSDYIFQVEDLLRGGKRTVNGRRLKVFRNKEFEISEKVKNHFAHQKNELLVVSEFQDIREKDSQVELLTAWREFQEAENSWVSLELMRENVPVLVREFLEELRKDGTKRQRIIAEKV